MAIIKKLHLVLIVAIFLGYFAFKILPTCDQKPFGDLATYLARKLPGHETNPDIDRSIHQLIESRRFESESHYITTLDGYIIQVVRIVNPFIQNRSTLKPVLLFHGYMCSSTLWVVASNGTLMNDGHYYEYDEHNNLVNASSTVGNTLGFVLASQGYDVWLANYRGSIYSSNHTTLSTDDSQFWSFSIDEMINIDLPAIIEYITKLTNHQTIPYISHSQGSFLMFTLLSQHPKFANIVKPFIAISPVVFTNRLKTPARHFQIFKSILRSNPQPFFHINQLRIFYSQLCSNILLRNLCFAVYSFFTGSARENIDMARLGVYLANIPMGSSSRNGAHFFQMFEHGNPSWFDFGDDATNIAKYGTATPPLYNLSNINSTNIALIYLKDDWFNPLENVHLLKDKLTVDLLEDYQVEDHTLNHMDMVWGKTAGQHINSKVLHILRQFED